MRACSASAPGLPWVRSGVGGGGYEAPWRACVPPVYTPAMPLPLPHAPPLAPAPARLQRGSTPLHKAAYYDHTAVAQVLLDRGADKEAQDNARGGAGARSHRPACD